MRSEYMKPILLSLLLGAAASAFATEIQLPAETAQFKPSSLPGYALVQRNCMTCHSVDYPQTQPPTSSRSYWEATVKKMKHPYGAQFDDADIPAMVDYLTKVYGAEQGSAAAVAAMVPASTNSPAARPASVGAPVKTDGALPDARALLSANNCLSCHAVDKTIVGPPYKAVAAKYAHAPDAEATVTKNIRAGGAGKWGPVPMPPYGQLSEAQARSLARYVLSQ
jgi:sulfite dehydrogenase